jgi:uncharacterized protein
MSERLRLPLHVMAKPMGPLCNLDCAYCYYLNKEKLYPSGERWRMSDETLERFVRQYIAAQPPEVKEIVFGWHGGEPMLMGVEFYRRAVELQQKHTPPGRQCLNSMQTNGVLLDEAWCALFQEHGFLIGLSIDGPADVHDRCRVGKHGEPTLDRVIGGLNLLNRHGIDVNALVVVHRHNGNHSRRVYRFLTEHGVRFLQFIPIVERMPEVERGGRPGTTDRGLNRWNPLVSRWSVRPEQFGQFLIEVFEEWVRKDVGRVFVQIFDQALSAWMGTEPSLCIFQRRCGMAPVLEHNGDLYSCDHFVEPECRLGNIHETPLAELAVDPRQTRFGVGKETALPRYCRECNVRFACNGECPKNRFILTPDGEPGLNYLCAGYKTFFRHVDPYMRAMARELHAGQPAANVMHRLRAKQQEVLAASRAGSPVGRNDPCPCGSGRKFKRCCGTRSARPAPPDSRP